MSLPLDDRGLQWIAREHGQDDRANDGRGGKPLALLRAEAAAGIPDQVADAAERVMDQGPGVAEQDQPADQRAGKPFEARVAGGPGRGGHQPPGQQQRAEIEAESADPMEARHHHRQREPVDLKVRRQRSCGGRLGFGHCVHPNWLDGAAELKPCPIQSGRAPQSCNNASGRRYATTVREKRKIPLKYLRTIGII